MLPEAKERFANLLPSGYSKISQPVDGISEAKLLVMIWRQGVALSMGLPTAFIDDNPRIQDALNLLNVWPNHMQFSCHSDIWIYLEHQNYGKI